MEHEVAGLTVSVEFPLSEGLRARSGLKGGVENSRLLRIIFKTVSDCYPAIACYDTKDTK